MSAMAQTRTMTADDRARQSQGTSDAPIYDSVARILEQRNLRGDLIVDVGCGAGNLWPIVRDRFRRYAGVDAVRYDSLPDEVDFKRADLNASHIPFEDEIADTTVAVETIEHLENPRGFMRELVRITKPSGLVIVSTPNQLSLLSLLTLVIKQRFSAFQDVHYPAHLTALLEIDLVRMAHECSLEEIEVAYTQHGRVILTPWHYPSLLSRVAPRLCSDNLVLIGKKRP